MDVDVALITAVDRRKDNFLIFGTGKSLNERFTPCETMLNLTRNEDFVPPSKIAPSKNRVVFKNQKYVTVHERFSSYEKCSWGEDKKHAEVETRRKLEKALRSFSKRRRTVVSSEDRNKELSKPHSKPEKKILDARLDKKTNRFSPGNLELIKPHRCENIYSEVMSDEKMNHFSSDDLKSIKPHKRETNYLEATLDKKTNRFLPGDLELTKPYRCENIYSEVMPDKKMNHFSYDDLKSAKQCRNPGAQSSKVTLNKKMNRSPSGDLESTKPHRRENICSEVMSDKKMNHFSSDDLKSTKPHKRETNYLEATLDKKMNQFSSDDLKSVKQYRKSGAHSSEVTLDKKMNRNSSGDLESTKQHRKPDTNSLEVTEGKEINRFSSGDSKSLDNFGDKLNRKERRNIFEKVANSYCNLEKNESFKRRRSSENYVYSGAEDEYFINSAICGNYEFGRNGAFKSSPFHYYRKDIPKVGSYSWNSLYQWNRERPTKEQLDDEIDSYMSEVKLKQPTTEEEDLDSFVEEYIMETEKVLSLDDSEFNLPKYE